MSIRFLASPLTIHKLMVSLYPQGLAIKTTLDVLKGLTAIESMYPTSLTSGKLVCIPDSEDNNTVYSVLPGERIYDLGRRANWRQVMDQSLFYYNNNRSIVV